MKKIVSLMLAVMMLACMALTGLAVNVTIDESGDYNAYLLLSATNAGDKYSYTVNTKYLNILQTATSETNEDAIVAAIAEMDASAIRTFADSVYRAIKAAGLAEDKAVTGTNVLDNIAQGYWLIADVTDLQDENAVNSLVMLDTAGSSDVTVDTKKDIPSVEKKIVEDGAEKDVADFNIGDTINFKLSGKVSNKIGSYETYTYEFHDTMTNMTYVDGSAVVTVDGTPADIFTVTWDAATKKLDIVTDNLKKIATVNAATTVVVTYQATLDDTAVIGGTGNPNEVFLTYSNDPYSDSTGNTEEDVVVVFTFELAPVKVDGKNTDTKLEEAEFVLYRMDGEDKEYVVLENGKVSDWTKVEDDASVVKSGADGVFGFEGLDAGTYYLKETKAPNGYNLLKNAIEVIITATYKIDGTIDQLTATADAEAATATANDGVISFEIANFSGTELPSTGGIGTTIFYILGSILLIGAGILLVTQKRMKQN